MSVVLDTTEYSKCDYFGVSDRKTLRLHTIVVIYQLNKGVRPGFFEVRAGDWSRQYSEV